MDNQENNQINNTQADIPNAPDQGVNQAPENHPMGVPTENPVADSKSSQSAENVNSTPPPPADSAPAVSDPPPPKSDSKLLFFIIGAGLVLVIILLLIMFSGSLNKSNIPVVPTPQAQQIVTPTPAEQGQEIPQNPITSQQDVTNTLGDLDKVNPDTVGKDLSQNDQDASTFSQ